MSFFLSAVTSHRNVKPLTLNEFETPRYPRITLTNTNLIWDTSTTIYEDQEKATLDYKGEIIWPNTTATVPLMVINYVCMSTCVDAPNISSDEKFAAVLHANANVSSVNEPKAHNVL